ncbi:hypothetical protein TeGR_g2048 [Tetraparma gracilis]|uniref:Uncharacterized protein n=1 Tax=Tetraparma gracilis TaxID=2962635 RepID=A0ABQ6MAJ0_9STRA|nr:hypothetical protein TeGR_g2048 [Tetraparma gracilis]
MSSPLTDDPDSLEASPLPSNPLTSPPPPDPLSHCIRFFPCTNSPPPCVWKITCCWSFFENNLCCLKFGRIGSPTVSPLRRRNLFYLASLLTTAGIILSLVALFGLGYDTHGGLRHFSWAKGRVNGADVFVGLRAITVEYSPSNSTTYRWDTAECPGILSADVCEPCKEAALGTVTLTIMGLVTYFPQLTTDLLRSQRDLDVRCQKVFGVLTGLWGCFSTLLALNSFRTSCRVHLDDLPGNDWYPGPGLVAITIASAIKIFDVALHLYVQVPEPPPSHRVLRAHDEGKVGAEEQVELVGMASST